MKILYGINATGNGHLSRARVIISELKQRGHDITTLFSGNDKNEIFDIDDFKPFIEKKGFTFQKKKGKIKLIKTLFNADLIQFRKDINSLKNNYDMVLTDFEPVSAYFARKRRLPIIGLGHQYSFYKKLPITLKMRLLRIFFPYVYTPVNKVIASHFYHFNQDILPPFLAKKIRKNTVPSNTHNNILVYTPWEDFNNMVGTLNKLKNRNFIYYYNVKQKHKIENVIIKPFSEENFKLDLIKNKYLITNAGFQLPAEAIFIGKQILCKPLNGQPEQEHNGEILKNLGYATLCNNFCLNTIESWLKSNSFVEKKFLDPLPLMIKMIENSDRDFSEEILKLWD